MKKTFIISIIFALIATSAFAQEGNKTSIDDVVETGKSIIRLFTKPGKTNSGETNSPKQKNPSTSSETTQVNFADPVTSSSSSTPQMKITTNSPYMKVSITKCAANGKTVILEFKMINTSGEDANGVGLWAEKIVVYDDQGNEYKAGLKFANKEFNMYGWQAHDFIADIPIKVAIQVEGVSSAAESLARVTLPFDHNKLGLKADSPITLRNIPITRE